jgi:DNA-binding NarL/FixJ family response regulator
VVELVDDRAELSPGDAGLAAEVARLVAANPPGAAHLVARAVQQACEAEQVSVVSVDPATGRCEVLAIVGPDLLAVGTTAPAELSTRLLRAIDRRSWASADFSREPGFERAIDQLAKALGFQSGCSVPILAAGRAVGAVLLTSMIAQRSWSREIAEIEAVTPMLAVGLRLMRPADPRLRVLVLHRDPLVAHGLARVIEHGLQADVSVATGPFDPWLDQHLAGSDVVLTDDGAFGISVAGVIRGIGAAGGSARVVVVAADDAAADAAHPARAVAAGAAVVVGYSMAPAELAAAVARAAAGAPPAAGTPDGTGILPALTPREQQLLRELHRGLPYKRIAAGMGLSAATVRGYSRGLYAKLGAHSRGEAVHEAQRQGLLPG